MQAKAAEYRDFGIEKIWIIDPTARMVYRYTGAALDELKTGELQVASTPIRIVISEMFGELDSI